MDLLRLQRTVILLIGTRTNPASTKPKRILRMGDNFVVSHGRGGIALQEASRLHTWDADTTVGTGNINKDDTQ